MVTARTRVRLPRYETEYQARLALPQFCGHTRAIARVGRDEAPCLGLKINAARAAGGHGIHISVV